MAEEDGEGRSGRASDEAIDRLVDALDERNDHMSSLIKVASDVNVEVKGLRRDITSRPTRQENEHRRRVAMVGVVLFAYLLMLVSDINVNQCSPGHKAGVVVDQIAKGVELTPAQFRALADRRLSPACDVAFPLHIHDGRDTWPTRNNFLGMLLIFFAAVSLRIYTYGPRGWRPVEQEEAT